MLVCPTRPLKSTSRQVTWEWDAAAERQRIWGDDMDKPAVEDSGTRRRAAKGISHVGFFFGDSQAETYIDNVRASRTGEGCCFHE